MASLSASEIFGDSILNFLDDGEDEFTTSCEDEVDRILSSIPADIIEQVGNEPQPGPSSCVVDSEIEKLKQKNWNKNTTRSTNTWVRRFESWYSQQPRQQARLEEIPVQELDGVLQEFYCHVRKQNGDEYEPDSLRTMLAALDRHLSGCGCSYSIMKDREFRESRLVLNGKAIQLRENGKGKKSRKADPLTAEEEEILWNTGVLGGDNPKSLNHTVFYIISQQFGTRGRQEHHQIRIEHLRFVCNPQSGATEFIEWEEGLTKTRQGGLVKQQRRMKQKVFATGDSRCPVKFIERLISKRPSQLKTSGPLYLQPLKHTRENQWYSVQPVGINQVDKYMKDMAAMANLDTTNKNFTNHSIRKTTVCKLQKAGISNDKIAAITGHKNEQSLRDYASAYLDDHRKLSNILSATPVSARTPLTELDHNHGSSSEHGSSQFSFHNCTVHFYGAPNPAKKPKRIIIDSDED